MKILLFLLSLCITGCTTIDKDQSDIQQQYMYDPLECFNRLVFEMNNNIYSIVIFPHIEFYDVAVPNIVKKGINNIAWQYYRSISVINSILQFNLEQLAINFTSLLVNTIFGFGGIIDIAEFANIEKKSLSFADTLSYYNIPPMVYIVLPLFGPSSLTYCISNAADFYLTFSDISEIYNITYFAYSIDSIKNKKECFEIINDSFDPYNMIRKAFYDKCCMNRL